MIEGVLRVVIVDDEEPARLALRQDLQAFEDVEIVAECANGFEAVKVVGDTKPDLILLDVQMPKLDGFEVLELIGGDVPVIFVTAYDEFAIKAFERAAVDYVLKPATTERLAMTAARLRERLAKRAAVPAPGEAATLFGQVQAILAPTNGEPERIRIIRASVGNTVRMIPVADVICLEAADKYVTVVTANGEALVRMSLRELATRLDGVELVQVHRGVMVNASCMTTATRNELGHLSLRLRGLAREVKVSRAFAHLFRPM